MAPKIYHLHPLVAGKLADWPEHFSRCQEMGFNVVCIAPPFAPAPVATFSRQRTTRHYTRRSTGRGPPTRPWRGSPARQPIIISASGWIFRSIGSLVMLW